MTGIITTRSTQAQVFDALRAAGFTQTEQAWDDGGTYWLSPWERIGVIVEPVENTGDVDFIVSDRLKDDDYEEAMERKFMELMRPALPDIDYL